MRLRSGHPLNDKALWSTPLPDPMTDAVAGNPTKDGRLSLLRVVEIPPCLTVHPKCAGRPQELGEAKSSAGSYTTPTIHELIDPLIRAPDCVGQNTLSQTHGVQELLEEHLPRMSRLTMSWDTDHGMPQWWSTISTSSGPAAVQRKQIQYWSLIPMLWRPARCCLTSHLALSRLFLPLCSSSQSPKASMSGGT